jgi:hypothetical protein
MITLNGTTGITTPGTDSTTLTVNANNISASNSLGFRNRIINGDMRIDQRNAGASVTVNGNFPFSVDRVLVGGVGSAGTFTAQQTSTSATGFPQALVCTTGTADAAIASGDYYFPFLQRIEGFNISDLGWGTANAQPVTISFWVRSNVTGTYPVAVRNNASDRSYVATVTISSANVFEYKTVTIAGDTSGTWLTTNGTGIQLSIGAIAGSASQTTAGAWAAGNFYTTSACTNWMATTGNTFYLTGVQLEAGSVATPFERIDYGRQLIQCQRYYQKYTNALSNGYNGSGGLFYPMYIFPVELRATPTMVYSSVSYSNASSLATNIVNNKLLRLQITISSTGGGFAEYTMETSGTEL